MRGARVLVVDDDETLRTLLAAELDARGCDAASAPGTAAATELLGAREFDAAIVDLRLGDGSGLDLVRWVRAQRPRTELVMLTGHGTIETAIEAMRAGAFDYLRKPCPMDELEVVLQKALEHQALVERNSILREGLAPPDPGAMFVGESRTHKEIMALVDRVAPSDSSVLILGETGVGKDVVARLLHARSPRAAQPLVVVECASLQEELLNSELFGHEKGAYTGAATARHGLFEVADKGTIFLDEVGDVSPATQVKLLRVLETGMFRRVGGTREITVDVRVVAATNRDLKEMMDRGYFRKDLFFRLSTIRVDVPPLRERADDIPLLTEHFLARIGARQGRTPTVTPAALARLHAYAWPGNCRELLHAIERAVLVAPGPVVDVEHLPPEVRAGPGSPPGQYATLAEVERRHIVQIVREVGGNRARAAKILGISERTLYRKLREYGMEAGEEPQGG